MKSALIYIGVLLSVCACRSEEFPLRTGDLLFQVNEPSEMTEAITDASAPHDRHKISHVAIFQQAGDRRLVIEATGRGGVRKVTLEEFLRSSARIEGRPGVLAMRVRAEFPVGEAIRRAEVHLGEPYDYSYLPDNGRMYCSELVYESYRREDGTPLFTARPMNFRNAEGELPDFWIELFEQLGEPIPEGIPGTNPADMAKEPVLEEVYRYF